MFSSVCLSLNYTIKTTVFSYKNITESVLNFKTYIINSFRFTVDLSYVILFLVCLTKLVVQTFEFFFTLSCFLNIFLSLIVF